MTTPTPKDILRSIARRAMIERGFLPDFSPQALAETRRAVEASATGPRIRDLRSLLWCSIDNDDSRDLDQLSVSTAEDTALVAIADVDALVPQGSAVDQHAHANTTSIYTPAQIFPMLPERYSTDLTSLNEGADRLAVVVEFQIDERGNVVRSEIYRAFVHNIAKLAYPSVGAWLEGKAPPPPKVAALPKLEAQLRTQDGIAQKLGAVRQQHGALNLKTIEAKAVFSGEQLSDLRAEEK